MRFLIFVVLTIAAWGMYGPILHNGQVTMGDETGLSRWKPFVCVGIAYFLIAVVYPALTISREGKGNWSPSGMLWSFFSGAVGAFGALGIILAFMFGGKPVYVMPLVFGFAPVVNTFVTALMARTIKQASVTFYIGVLVVAIGGAGVMFFKPSPPPKHASLVTIVEPAVSTALFQDEGEGDAAVSSDMTANDPPADDEVSPSTPPANGSSFPMMIASIALTALCWGTYGPLLHKGQAKMGGSRLRPFLMVGLAYLVFAVILPLIFWQALPPDPGTLNTTGVIWSLLGGAVGALGALGIIYAFNFGGKPITIMPLVFGGAPVINTIVTTVTNNTWSQLEPQFFISLFLVIGGAVTVLVNAPRGNPPAKAAA